MEFHYQAKNETGQLFEGTVEAPEESTAVDILHSKGYIVISLLTVPQGLFSGDIALLASRPRRKDVVLFTRQMSTLVEADVPLTEGLRTLSRQIEKPTFRKIIADISDAVEGGSSLSAALSQYPRLFSTFYVKLVRSGELSGKLQTTLSYLADHLERDQVVTSKIRSALAYPTFVVVAMIVVTVIMVTYVLPQLLVIFKESGITDLPITTRALIFITDTFNNYFLVVMMLVIGGGIAFWRYIHTEKGRAWYDDIKLHIPGFGRILRNLYLASVSESLSTLVKAEIPILEALEATSDLTANTNFRTILKEAYTSVQGGETVSAVFERYEEIPPLMSSMVAIGERTGKFDYMLAQVAKFYRMESENDIDSIAQLIEPVLVLILGAGVAMIVAGVLLPIYNLVSVS